MKSIARDDGFTLVEMLVVLGLLAAMIAISLPYVKNSGHERRLDSAAQDIASQLAAAQQRALLLGREESVSIDLKEKHMTGSWSKLNTHFDAALSFRILTARNELVEDTATFRFFPEGGATGGRIILSNGSSQREIDISWLTGAVVLAKEVSQ